MKNRIPPTSYSLNRLTKFELHTIHIVIILISGIALGSLAIGFLIKSSPLINYLDSNLYSLIHNLPRSQIIDQIFYPINYNFIKGLPWNIPAYLYLLNIVFFLYLLIFKRSLFIWGIFCAVLGTILTLIIAGIDWLLVFRERPFINLPNTVPPGEAEIIKLFSSYPSGHARETVLYATIIGSFIPRIKWPTFIFAIAVCISRVYYGFHFPTDVIAGGIIGFLSGKTILLISRELQILWENKRKGVKHGQRPESNPADIDQS